MIHLTEKKSQVVASLSTAFVFIVIGLPLWWNTTKVYRAALPYDEIENLPHIKVRHGIQSRASTVVIWPVFEMVIRPYLIKVPMMILL